MIENKSYMSKIEKARGDYVSFGGGEKSRIIGKRLLSVEGLPELEGVLLVEGLAENIFSISQLCDNEMKVSFSKEACCVNDSSDLTMMKGTKSSDNCYL
ncbi:hypothetical protein LIER_05234 [Lithospermum erythrorhizon]|uniref:Uncharacterized protein n=1 Tax=Lithospermum erythrorhizon TaxID=34254 RepID=A0AAV3NZT5_LITER